MWSPQARWEKVAYVHPGPDGAPLFVHRCADKFRFEKHKYTTNQNHPAASFQPNLPLERECWDWMNELAKLLGRTAEEIDERPADLPLA